MEGAVSVEGTVAGLIASIFLYCVACLLHEVDVTGAVICVITSQIANIEESIVGASFQEKEGFQWSNNDIVNIVHISIGSMLAVLMQQFLQNSRLILLKRVL